MSDAAVARTDHELQLLAAMVDCAFELGMAFSDAAKAETDHDRKLQLFEAFCRGSLAVRMGIRLSMALRAPPKAARAAAVEQDDVEPIEVEREETERLEVERERERDYEPVSLPKFLATLGVVAADAARLDRLPADIREGVLPTLNGLLARSGSAASGAVTADVLPRPAPAAPKGRLFESASLALPKALPLAGLGRPRPPPG